MEYETKVFVVMDYNYENEEDFFLKTSSVEEKNINKSFIPLKGSTCITNNPLKKILKPQPKTFWESFPFIRLSEGILKDI